MQNGNAKKFEVEDSENSFMNGVPKPFVKWVGGKRQLLDELERRVPDTYQRYFEPFIGGGALYFRLRPRRAYIADVNSELINAYKVIKGDVENLIEDLQKHIYDKDYYYSMREIDRLEEYKKWSSYKKASRLIYLNKTCFNGLYRVNSKGYFNTPFGKYTNPKILDPDNLRACSKLLRGARIAKGSFLSIEKHIKPEDFVYFDPPYAPINETSYFTDYSKGGFDSKMQEELRDLCLRLDSQDVRFMLSNSDVPLIRKLYKGFKIEKVLASRAVNSKAEKRGKITELIITNYR